MSIEIKYHYEHQDQDLQNLYNPDTYYTRDLINRFSSLSNNTVVKRNVPLGSIRLSSASGLTVENFRSLLSFERHWQRHEVTAMAGFELRQASATGYGYGYYGEKGDHIRLQDIRLDYQLALTGTVRKYIQTLGIYFYATNLGILWRANKQHLDPDYSVAKPAGATSAVLPEPASYAFGLNIHLK
ncbi:hypothetical protein SAMN05216436_1171 [bacterium A37T11]|nr:hypothetical protein SAMN05216436_1171 [bacterium A37T11]